MISPFVFKEDPLRTASLLRSLADDIERLSMFRPTAEEIKSAPLISNWRLGKRGVPCLLGRVHEHPVLGDREAVTTSELIALDASVGWARTASRFYRLGFPAMKGCGR